MEIQTLGPRALLVYAAEEELRRWRVNPRRPGAELLLLSRWALAQRGVSVRRLTEISVLSARRSLLLLLRLSAVEEEWFPFPDLGLAAEAVSALSRPPEGVLVWDGSAYLLGIRSAEQAARLSEYALPLSPADAEGLEERCTLVLDRGALEKLWKAVGGT